MTDEEIVEALKKDNENFKKLYQEHRELNALLDDLNKKHYLTPEEEFEKKRMQKEKLARKDRIAELVRDYKKNHNN
jgi:uncharacterized protein YdcH (DUF465 family)